MKTQAKQLEWKKSSIVELNTKQLIKVIGGTSTINVVYYEIPTSGERPTTSTICKTIGE